MVVALAEIALGMMGGDCRGDLVVSPDESAWVFRAEGAKFMTSDGIR